MLHASKCFENSSQHSILCSVLQLLGLIAAQLNQIQIALRGLPQVQITSTFFERVPSMLRKTISGIGLHDKLSDIDLAGNRAALDDPSRMTSLPLLFMSLDQLCQFLTASPDADLSIIVSRAYKSARYKEEAVDQTWVPSILLQVGFERYNRK